MNDFDPSVPNVARVYDALQDGKNNFGADRKVAEAIRTLAQDGSRAAHDNRAFLSRAVRFLAGEAGISQFIDIGSGMPAAENTHEIARSVRPETRVAYLDNDLVVLRHAAAIREKKRESIALPGDLRKPREILGDPALRDFIDFGQPVAIMLLAVLHFIEDPAAREAAGALMREMPPGSYLVISHASADQATPDEVSTISRIYDEAGTPIFLRTRDEITGFFAGLELAEPGVVNINAWRNPGHEPGRTIGYGGVAFKGA